MKKTYINPSLNVVKMKISQPLLDASSRSILNESATTSEGYYDDARGFDFTDDED